METLGGAPGRPPHVRALPVVGGQLALDFANTVDNPAGPEEFDHVGTYPLLLEWALRLELLPDQQATALRRRAGQHPAEADGVVQQGAALRDALADTFGALVDGRPVEPGWQRLRPFVAEAVQRASVTAGPSPLRLSWASDALGSPLWPVAEAAGRLLVAPELRRLKRCASCPWLFLDSSRNGSRRWCSMQYCGTDAKIRRYVTRRAERRVSGAGG